DDANAEQARHIGDDHRAGDTVDALIDLTVADGNAVLSHIFQLPAEGAPVVARRVAVIEIGFVNLPRRIIFKIGQNRFAGRAGIDRPGAGSGVNVRTPG